MEKRTIEAIRCTCERCGHVWFPDIQDWIIATPVQCAKCKSPLWKQKKPKKSGFLYVIGNAEVGKYKIGSSTNPRQRLKTLQTGSPISLILLGEKFVDDVFQAERDAHASLDQFRPAGSKKKNGAREWFELTMEQALSVIK